MQITYLGHAGFCVETSRSIIIVDPWLSPLGAFDSAWFQFPCNHHLGALVQEKLQDPTRRKYIYISHEHKDHFDPPFLNSLIARDFTFILPHFRRSALRDMLAGYQCDGMITCQDGQVVPLEDGFVQLFLDDAELDRDSTILIKADGSSFLDMNDCKLHDRLPEIRKEHGEIDAFAAQFSGATWHPTCYDYAPDVYQKISKKKMISKFEATAKAIEAVKPKMYLPSAGPACFLDPILAHLNYEPVNIFPRNFKVLDYLDKRLRRSHPLFAPDLMPGDVLDVARAELTYRAPDRVTEANVKEYLAAYQARFEGLFSARRNQACDGGLDRILERLKHELESKLSTFTLSERVDRRLYFRFREPHGTMLRVNFQERKVEPVSEITEENYYAIAAPSWEIERVLNRRITWEDFSLTFRMRLTREPDIYQTLIQGFLIMEPEDLNHFCARLLRLESQKERIVVEAGGTRYSCNRICPHQGGDLSEGWIEEDRYLVCARHRWRYDLQNGGKSDTSSDTIEAIALEPA
ncbi:MAG: MBL fold metallo-hydrolase [Chloroflexi bacterium]|nr:MBL fold metallo-hydrolase [Chloroflexota bacterium]